MTGIYKKFKSGTDIRGIGIGNGDEPLYMSDEFIARASAAFADFLAEKTGKAAEALTVAIGHDPRLSAERISAAVVRGLALRGVNIIDCALSSTPAMFMAVLDLPCDGSVQMTASHHPGDRNGLKFFTVDGGLDSPDIAYILEKAENIELGDVPAKITSAMFEPRSARAPCSPITQASASTTLDLPDPLGPTTHVMPGWRASVVALAKDLKPRSVRFLRYTLAG